MIVGLIMLLLMTIVGLAAIRGSGLQEMMAGNMRDRNLAFQSAEAGLRAGEDILDAATLPAFDGTQVGMYEDLNQPGSNPGAVSSWVAADWGGNSVETSMDFAAVADAPRYVIERLETLIPAGSDGGAVDFESQLNAEEVIYYRVTSRGVGGSVTSEVILQSTVKP